MTTLFPNGLDTFVNPTASDSLNSATVPHVTQHDNINDAVKAIETALGTVNNSNTGALITKAIKVESWAVSAFENTIYDHTPVVTWTSSMTTALTSPVVYLPQKCGIGSTTASWDGISDPNFRYFPGDFNTHNGGSGDLALYGNLKPGGNAQAAYWPLVFEFDTSSTNNVVEISFYGNPQPNVKIEVNGRYVSQTVMRKTSSSYPESSMTLTFPYGVSRRIRIWAEGDIGLVAVRVPTGQSITKPAETITRRIAFIGDSYVNGSGAGNSNPMGTLNMETFAPRLGKLMKAQSMILAGIGGTGWVAGTGGLAGAANPYSTRLTAVLAMNPHAIVFYGSINDGSGTSAAVQAAVTAALTTCAAIPEIYVIGPLLGGYSLMNNSVKAGTLAGGKPFIDLGNFIHGTGNISNPTGVGNSDWALMPDNFHPTFDAHRAIAIAAYQLIQDV